VLIADLPDDWAARAAEFSAAYDTQLAIGSNDCRHYARQLVQHLSGQDLQPLHRLSLESESELTLDVEAW